MRNQISSQDEKMKSLEHELFESKAKIENLTSTKPAVDNRSMSRNMIRKTLQIIHDNRGQWLALRSKDLKQKSYLLWYHLLVFRPLKTQLD